MDFRNYWNVLACIWVDLKSRGLYTWTENRKILLQKKRRNHETTILVQTTFLKSCKSNLLGDKLQQLEDEDKGSCSMASRHSCRHNLGMKFIWRPDVPFTVLPTAQFTSEVSNRLVNSNHHWHLVQQTKYFSFNYTKSTRTFFIGFFMLHDFVSRLLPVCVLIGMVISIIHDSWNANMLPIKNFDSSAASSNSQSL